MEQAVLRQTGTVGTGRKETPLHLKTQLDQGSIFSSGNREIG